MIQRVEHENGVVTYQSDLLRNLGIPHAFSTRIGGVSPPPYDSLNLGYLTKGAAAPDDNTNVSENFRRLRAAIALRRHWRAQVRQVHGANVYVPTEPRRLRDAPQADAVITDIPNAMPTVRTADCVPDLLASADGRVVSAVHAGWRGIVAGVVASTIRTMAQRFHVEPSGVVAAIGPCIRVKHFEVGDEVASEFERVGLGEDVCPCFGAKKHIDLPGAVARQLNRAGVTSIDRTDRCTHEHAAEFFSYRRDKGTTGHLAAVIATRGA